LLTISPIALLQFAFQLGGAVSLCISQALFLNRLAANVRSELPDIAIYVVVDAGAFNLRILAPLQAQLRALRSAYQDATRDVFVLLLVASGVAFVASFGFEHKNVKQAEKKRKEVENNGVQSEI
jgi:hypothetical protein